MQKQNLQLEHLEGKWYINMSDFPMWLRGDKTNPTFNYTVQNIGGIICLKDEVIYLKNNKLKSIRGFDYLTDNSCLKYVWRGEGILKLLQSYWEIMFFDFTESWAIINFQKTLFTPKGYDVISRCKQLNSRMSENIYKKLTEMKIDSRLTIIKQE